MTKGDDGHRALRDGVLGQLARHDAAHLLDEIAAHHHTIF
jgi:hypothetical protein